MPLSLRNESHRNASKRQHTDHGSVEVKPLLFPTYEDTEARPVRLLQDEVGRDVEDSSVLVHRFLAGAAGQEPVDVQLLPLRPEVVAHCEHGKSLLSRRALDLGRRGDDVNACEGIPALRERGARKHGLEKVLVPPVGEGRNLQVVEPDLIDEPFDLGDGMKRGLAGGLRGVLASGHRRVDLKGPLVDERNDLADAEGGNANDHGGSEGVVEGLNLGRKIGRHCNDNHRDGETRSCSGVGGVIDFELRSLEVAEGEGEPDVEPVQVEGKPLHLHAVVEYETKARLAALRRGGVGGRPWHTVSNSPLPANRDAADPDVLGSADGGDEGEEPVHVQDVENDGRQNEEHDNGCDAFVRVHVCVWWADVSAVW